MPSLFLEGLVIPKKRPRVTRNATFMPPAYAEWLDDSAFLLSSQWRNNYPNFQLEFPLIIAIAFIGKHPKRGDLDNLSGAVLDALVKGAILPDDSVKFICTLYIKFDPDPSPPSTLIVLENSIENIGSLLKK